MRYTLIHYKRTQIKGKYNPICTITYSNKWTAYNDAREVFDNATDPEYAGFAIKDENGHTLVRRLKPSALEVKEA